MPKIDISITISVIVALCAIISPILTTIINNRYQMKVKKLEAEQRFYEDTIVRKRTIFENYLKAASRCAIRAKGEYLAEYGEYYISAFIYAPSDIRTDMINIHNLMTEYKWIEAIPLIEELTPKIADLISNM